MNTQSSLKCDSLCASKGGLELTFTKISGHGDTETRKRSVGGGREEGGQMTADTEIRVQDRPQMV